MAADVLADRAVGPGVRAGTVLLRAAGLVAELAGLREREVNYDESDAPRHARDPRWHVDSGYALLGTEPPGPPVAGGVWETACALVRRYEFTDHRLLRGVFRPGDPLLGRDMLLEGRYLALRFYLGVRVTDVVDAEHANPGGRERVWGWTYRTLQGHLEQGELSYEVVKDLETGAVTFWIHAYSRRGPIPNPIIRLGFRLFGRDTQLRFYRRVGRRMHRLVKDHRQGAPLPGPVPLEDGSAIAPSTTRMRWWDPIALPLRHPGR
ncbi:DUF1990 family protein [Pseudonocardia sp. H11422]|uniref:DUF1990 family protein n=1 Tax=Pseudonocardia sp. H11422 TaxID=2835866 RepID=UPI0027E25B45|nr:DUF1990 family protein [Pseudonocardia sp. H11422]